MRKIGLDLGSRTCGICISDATNQIASGLCNFKYDNNNMMLIIQKLKQIVLEYEKEVDTFVLGYPTNNLNNTKVNSTLRVEKFKSLLETHFNGIKVVYVDENYSTSQATEYLMQYDIKASQRKKIIDLVSSTIILQKYLDQNKL